MMELWNLPHGWEWKPLRNLATDTERRNPKTKPDETFYYVDISSVDNSTGTIDTEKVRSIVGKDAPSRARKVIHADDVIFATTRPYLKNIAIVPKSLDNQICSTGFCVIRAISSLAIPKYLYYATRSDFFISQLIPKQRGANYPAVTDSDVYDLLIPVPYPNDPIRSLAEQRRIVARIEALLAEVRAARALHEEIVRDTGRLMDAVLGEVFDPKVTVTWPYEAPLGELVKISAPMVDPTLDEYQNLPHIYGKVIESGTGRLLQYRTAAEDGMRSGKYHFQPGSILYSKIRPYLRKVTIVDFEGLCSADMYPLVIKEDKRDKLIPEFLMWSLLSPDFTNYANALSTRARMPKLNRSQLFSYILHFPDRTKQKILTERLFAVREEINEMQKTQAENGKLLDEMEQAILAQAFRGEL